MIFVKDKGNQDAKVIDATNAPLGRLASVVAKRLLKGEKITIINASNAIITGSPQFTKNKYQERRARGSPQHGPFFPRGTEGILRRAIRGMLPRKKASGREAFRRLIVHLGSAGLEGESFAKEIRTRYITLKELSREIGGKGD